MATTYTKGLKTASIHVLGLNGSFLVSDTIDNPSATRAIGQFLNKETMMVDIEGMIGEIPFHAVEYIEVTESTSNTIERTDAYCDDGGDE